MSTDPGHSSQIEGAEGTAGHGIGTTPGSASENADLIVGGSAPYNPAAVHAVVPTEEPPEDDAPGSERKMSSLMVPGHSQPGISSPQKHPLTGWWWKCLLILSVLFVMILFVVWIGPTFIWNASSNATSEGTISLISTTPIPTAFPSLEPTLEPTLSPITLSPTDQPTNCPWSFRVDTFYDQDGLCTVTSFDVQSCSEVQDGQRYQYTMDTVGCSTVFTCSGVFIGVPFRRYRDKKRDAENVN